jgi:hypothetical protein
LLAFSLAASRLRFRNVSASRIWTVQILSRALERALARNVTPAVYTEDMFRTTHDAANREAVRAVARADLNLVGIAMRAERKVVDKIVDGLKFHG